MKRIICIILTLFITLSFAGCGKKNKDISKTDKGTSIENNNDQDKHKDDFSTSTEDTEGETADDSETTLTDDTEANDNNDSTTDTTPKKETPPQTPVPDPTPTPEPTPTPPTPTPPPTPAPDTTERVFKIVSKDIDYNIVDGGEIRTIGLGVAENLREILSTVSSQYFEGTSLELTTIETINSQKIAVVNLGGDSSYWTDVMQGSAGGQITQYRLIENVLQRQYPGYWIDGVRFTLGGQSVVNNDHCPALSQTTYR